MSVVINGKKYRPLNDKRRLLVQTDAIFNRALSLGYNVPDEDGKHAINNHIRDMIRTGIWDKLDIYFNFAYNNTALSNFSLINWKNPVGDLATANEGVTYMIGGWQGNNTDGFINTLFNPTIGINNYILNDACRGGVAYTHQNNGGRPFDGTSGAFNRMFLNNNNTNHRLNSGGVLDSGVGMAGTGFKLIYRVDANDISFVNKDEHSTRVSPSTSLLSAQQLILRAGGSYGADTIASYFLGGAITYNQSQLFRESYNNYLNRQGLSPVA